MSNIIKPIVRREWELIRDRIGLILAQELATQAQLDYDDVLFELPDVFIERYVAFNHTEMPAINVMVAQGEYTQETQQTQDGTWTFYVDAYATAKDEDDQRGDQYANMRLQRLIGMCQAIIMDSRFKTLLFEPGAISNRTVKGIMMADPTKAMEATNAVMARMTIEVRVSDEVELVDAIPLAEYATIAKLSDTPLGYLWGGTSTFTPPTTCADSVLNVNGVFLSNIPSGEQFYLVVVDTNGLQVGDVYGDTIIVPAQTADPVTMTFNTAPITSTPAGGSKAITVRVSGGGSNIGTKVTDTASSLIVEVDGVGDIYYNMPQPTWDVSYNTWDEGDHNDKGTYSNIVPSNGRVQVLANGDFYKVQFDKEGRGHTYRFLGLNGGYWNSDDSTYRLADHSISDRATVFEADDYAFDRLTGLGWYLVRLGAASLTAGIAVAEALTYNGFNNWHMPMTVQLESIVDVTILNPLYGSSSPIFDIQLVLKTCTPYGLNPSTHGWNFQAGGYRFPNRAYSTADQLVVCRDARGQF